MVKKPFFSIIIPTYNRASDLQFSLYCILRQSFLNFEIIISDNCSTDNTKEIIDKLKDRRIRYFKNKTNIGVVLNIKKTINHAKGKYIFLHSDDDFLLYENSLEEIYKKIKKYSPGYIRINYICLAPDKKRIFDFKANKSFTKDKYLRPHSENKKVLFFILGSDAAFITGIIFLNKLPSNIKIVDAEPFWGIEVLFYTAKKYGACFIMQPHIIASWSGLKTNKNNYHPLYSLRNGRLASENYLNAIRSKLDTNTYIVFLHNQLMGMYVRMFPLMKFFTGNKNMLQSNARIRSLDPKMTKSITYWLYFILALIFPDIIIKIVKNSYLFMRIRNIYLFMYIKFSKVDNNKQIVTKLKKLDQEYTRFLELFKSTTKSSCNKGRRLS